MSATNSLLLLGAAMLLTAALCWYWLPRMALWLHDVADDVGDDFHDTDQVQDDEDHISGSPMRIGGNHEHTPTGPLSPPDDMRQ